MQIYWQKCHGLSRGVISLKLMISTAIIIIINNRHGNDVGNGDRQPSGTSSIASEISNSKSQISNPETGESAMTGCSAFGVNRHGGSLSIDGVWCAVVVDVLQDADRFAVLVIDKVALWQPHEHWLTLSRKSANLFRIC